MRVKLTPPVIQKASQSFCPHGLKAQLCVCKQLARNLRKLPMFAFKKIPLQIDLISLLVDNSKLNDECLASD